MMAHYLAIAFLITFVAGRLADQRDDAYTRLMSLFRDVEPAWIGCVMFALLIALRVETARTAARLRCWPQLVANALIASALVLAALTPSYDGLCVIGANVAMIGLSANVAALLFIHDQWFWLGIHVLITVTLAFGALADRYGVWQKGMPLYFLATTVALNHAFGR